MNKDSYIIFQDIDIRAELRKAWEDSQSGVIGGHEEGGFILLDVSGKLNVSRWIKGAQNSIILPSHLNCKFEDNEIIASFHTHPNTGSNYLQEPSETDKRAVRNDPDLKGERYEGEFIISHEKVYLISPNGQMNEVGTREEILFKNNGD